MAPDTPERMVDRAGTANRRSCRPTEVTGGKCKMNADCMVWQGLTMGRMNAESVKAFSAVDEIDAQMIEMASAVVGDPRRRESFESDCPQLFAQMVQLAQKPRR